MTIEIRGGSAAQLYEEGLYQFRISGQKESSRNGPVLTLPDICILTLTDPRKRVLDDSIRNANPFFHLMEFVWMMAGRNDAKWLMQFNKQMGEYADDGILHAAYGFRWRYHYMRDQIAQVISMLRNDRSTRQAVLSMWDPDMDLATNHKDKACNTQIMFRYVRGALNMLVTNRSNDFIWGTMGANIVHMTFLHELVAHFSGLPLGDYIVVSNNQHIYTDRKDYEPAIKQLVVNDVYHHVDLFPTFQHSEDVYEEFVDDCENFCTNPDRQPETIKSEFIRCTVQPAYDTWLNRANHATAFDFTIDIQSPDWRLACQNWLIRKETLSSATSTALSP